MKKYILLYVILIFGTLIGCDKGDGSSDQMKSGDSVGGSLATFSLVGDYLYVVDSSKLNVFSVKNPENPVKVNSAHIGFDIETLFAIKDFLFIGSRNGMFIYSIENPENPTKLSEYRHFTACDPVVANADLTLAFVTLHSTTFCGNNLNVLQIYDITDLKKPRKIIEKGLTHPKGLAVYGKYLAVCDDELKFFSVENPENPVLVHSVNKIYKDLIFYNNKLFAFGQREVTQYEWTKEDFTDLTEISSVKY